MEDILAEGEDTEVCVSTRCKQHTHPGCSLHKFCEISRIAIREVSQKIVDRLNKNYSYKKFITLEYSYKIKLMTKLPISG